MLLNLALPSLSEYTNTAVIRKIHAAEGVALTVGSKLLDITVDISAIVPHDCPPISHYRMTLRDRVWLRRLAVRSGDEVAFGASLALFTTAPDEPLDGTPARAVRVNLAGIIDPADWLTGG